MGKKKIVFVLIAACITVVPVSVYISRRYHQFQDDQKKKQIADSILRKKRLLWHALSRALEQEIGSFNGDVGLVIKDLTTGWEISYNKNKTFPSASLVKIPVMIACFYAMQEGKFQLADTISLSRDKITGGSGVIKTMKPGASFTIEELLDLMITRSDNTAANILISMLGFEYLNATFQRLGLTETNIARRMMDFHLRNKGVDNFTTAAEMASLLEHLYRKKIINGDVSEMCLTFLKRQQVKDRIPAKLPSDVVIAHKTGLEKYVCHDVGIVFTVKGDYLICVLTKGEDGSRRAKELISTIALYTYSCVE